MRNAFIAQMHKDALDDPQLMILVSDNGAIVFDQFRKDCPSQFLNCGIAECNMVAMAAGLEALGKKPYIYTIANFMVKRAYEFIRNDIALQKRNVKVIGIGGGIAYSTLGPTHHATEDLALMRSLPNMTVLCPASPLEVTAMIEFLKDYPAPVYLRMGTNNEPELYEQKPEFRLGQIVPFRSGSDAAIVACGPLLADALKARELLKETGLDLAVYNLPTLKPLDDRQIAEQLSAYKHVFSLESHNVIGGLGSALAEILAEQGLAVHLKRLGLKDQFCEVYGSVDDLKAGLGLDAASIAKTIEGGLHADKRRLYHTAAS